MSEYLLYSADIIGMFCRLKMNTKSEISVRSSEMGVLIFIRKQNASVTPSMVSDFFKIAKPSVTSMVNALVDKEYLEKRKSEADKRSYILEVTEAGQKLLDTTFDDYIKTVETLKNEMGVDDFCTFIGLMEKANTILEKAD
ncbi:DNA-binding transcriptional regulator, MarR family [Alkalibacterium subtropicum]|uniref:DNA-binding transcriptional regulator, MarR family n=1 Tax=Alkalibacterium subtropicum TaxID=753702 RepID=A0A1I1HHE4_9LACT|nr:MarR family transcriptional regulator [Alkalibacterium subtropicum]SFC23457.1 DNA-binding transcriptional regulator, MarR family [Alkalibacterium subtropicum]